MAIISSPAVPAAEPMQALPAPSGQIPEDLSELDDRELLALAIGQQLGISQMQVSRLLARALGYLRPRVTGLPERPTDGAASA